MVEARNLRRQRRGTVVEARNLLHSRRGTVVEGQVRSLLHSRRGTEIVITSTFKRAIWVLAYKYKHF